MKCPENILLSRFIDAETTRWKAFKIKWHLRSCESCRNEIALLQEINNQLGLYMKKNEEDRSADKCLNENTLASYYDNTLSEKERQGVESHLAECGNCLHELFELEKTLVGKSDLVTVPKGFVEKVKALNLASPREKPGIIVRSGELDVKFNPNNPPKYH